MILFVKLSIILNAFEFEGFDQKIIITDPEPSVNKTFKKYYYNACFYKQISANQAIHLFRIFKLSQVEIEEAWPPIFSCPGCLG